MADKRGYNGYNGSYPVGAPYGGGYGAPSSGKKKTSKKDAKKRAERARRKEYNATMRARQNYAAENASYRARVAAIDGQGGIDGRYYKLAEDRKPRKEKDYFFVMRKFVCFLMFIVMLVSVAYFALGFIKIDAIPVQFTALFTVTEAKKESEENTDADASTETEEEKSVPSSADEQTEADKEEGEGEGEEGTDTTQTAAFDGTAYGALDPVFGFIKYVGNKLGMKLEFGDSPLYDSMIAKVEIGMADSIAKYIILAFPVAMIIYVITALIMAIKAFLGMFGRRIFKCFGLGSIVMILCAAVTAFGGLAYVTDVAGKMDFAKIVDILIGGITGTGGFTGGYGLLIMIALPLVTLILSMFARKKIPYSIFDTYGE
ncbi:MAG: hypothetical protein ACI4SK_03805 [Christensenellales bacterium]